MKKTKATKKQVKVVCESCGGTGLYEGMCEKEGHPVICLSCDGTGCETMTYTPFKKIRIIKGVESVSFSAGRFILTGVAKTGKPMTYKEFLSGKWRKKRK